MEFSFLYLLVLTTVYVTLDGRVGLKNLVNTLETRQAVASTKFERIDVVNQDKME